MRSKGNIQLDMQGRCWLHLPGQRYPVQLDPAQAELINSIVQPLAIQYQRALYMRGYVTAPRRRLMMPPVLVSR
jgi:hypothetical protein